MTMPCQVDFYVLQDANQSEELLACKLAMMGWEQGLRSLVVVADSAAAQRLDELMWSQPDGRFLPHGLEGAASPAPVTICTEQSLDQYSGEIVINLASREIPEPRRFQRLLEVVPARDEQRQASRRKFRQYRELGLQPRHHEISKP